MLDELGVCVCVYIQEDEYVKQRERVTNSNFAAPETRLQIWSLLATFWSFSFFFFANWQLWSLLATFWSWSWGISSTGQKARFTKKQIKKVDLLLAKNQFYPHKMNHISKTRFTIKLLYFLYFYFYIISIIIN